MYRRLFGYMCLRYAAAAVLFTLFTGGPAGVGAPTLRAPRTRDHRRARPPAPGFQVLHGRHLFHRSGDARHPRRGRSHRGRDRLRQKRRDALLAGDTCAVFRYEEFGSVLPEGVWRLERGTLVAADSPWLAALGVIAPLWDDAVSYAILFATVGIPGVGLWLFGQPRSRAGQALLALAVILAAFYALMWLYWLALLSRLLLHAVVLALLAGGGGLALFCWSALKLGIRTTTLIRAGRAAVAVVCAVCVARVYHRHLAVHQRHACACPECHARTAGRRGAADDGASQTSRRGFDRGHGQGRGRREAHRSCRYASVRRLRSPHDARGRRRAAGTTLRALGRSGVQGAGRLLRTPGWTRQSGSTGSLGMVRGGTSVRLHARDGHSR